VLKQNWKSEAERSETSSSLSNPTLDQCCINAT